MNRWDEPIRVTPDGRGLFVHPLTYGRGRFCIGRNGDVQYDDGW